jgi:hypothetical protein
MRIDSSGLVKLYSPHDSQYGDQVRPSLEDQTAIMALTSKMLTCEYPTTADWGDRGRPLVTVTRGTPGLSGVVCGVLACCRMAAGCGYTVRVGKLASKRAGGQWARWSTARDERPGPLAPGLLRLWRRRDGIPRAQVTYHRLRCARGIHPGAEVCRTHFCLMRAWKPVDLA